MSLNDSCKKVVPKIPADISWYGCAAAAAVCLLSFTTMASGQSNNLAQTFQAISPNQIFVLGSDGKLWLEHGPFGVVPPPRHQVDGNVQAFQALSASEALVLGTDGKLWLEHAPFGNTIPPARQQVDGNVRLFHALSSFEVLVVGTDGKLWLEHAPFGDFVPPAREQIDGNVRLFQAFSAFEILVLGTDGKLWLEYGPFGNVIPPNRQQVDGNVKSFQGLSPWEAFVLGTDGKLWLEHGPFGHAVPPPRRQVDGNVQSFQGLSAGEAFVLGTNGKLWLEHAPFGQSVPPPRQQVDGNVQAFEGLNGMMAVVLGTDAKLWLEFGTFGITIPPIRDEIDINVMLPYHLTGGNFGTLSFRPWGKLASTFNLSGPAMQGWSVALSGDGRTAMVGGPDNSNRDGAVWKYYNDGGQWVAAGQLPAGTNVTSAARQGYAVALSADGNTALVGGPFDRELGFLAGSAWGFSRNVQGYWDQGAKFVEGLPWNCTVQGQGVDCGAALGSSVALSADGKTAIVGGPNDNAGAGAAWVFTRNGSAWTEQGKLVFYKADGAAAFGQSVAISADGKTILVGGDANKGGAGAAWVFSCSSGSCLQRGPKLVGTGAIGSAHQGSSVALSSDGNTAVVGGLGDNGGMGAAWVFTRIGYTWTQQAKVAPSDAVGQAGMGNSVAVSPDGTIVVAGGPSDNSGAGAVWVFAPHGQWEQVGSKLTVAGQNGPPGLGYSVAFASTPNQKIILAGGPYDNGNIGAAWLFRSK